MSGGKASCQKGDRTLVQRANDRYRKSARGRAASQRRNDRLAKNTADKRQAYLRGPVDCEWRLVAFAPDYEVSEFGDVRRVTGSRTRKAGHILKPHVCAQGYIKFKLVIAGEKRILPGHRLVALAFIGEPPTASHEVAHNDGCRASNHFSNLRWATRKDNHADLQAHGTAVKGVRNGRAKLTEAQVRRMRAEYWRIAWTPKHQFGVIKRMRDKYGVSQSTFRNVVQGLSWRHVR